MLRLNPELFQNDLACSRFRLAPAGPHRNLSRVSVFSHPSLSFRFLIVLRAAIGGLSLLASARSSPASLVINEIHYAPEPKTSKVEFVELHNPGEMAVDLSGWRIAGGAAGTIPSGISIAPGGFLLFCQDTATVTASWLATSDETNATYGFSSTTGSSNPGTVLGGQDNWFQTSGGTALRVRNDPVVPGFTGNRGYSAETTIHTATRMNHASFSYAFPTHANILRLSFVGQVKNSATTTLGLGSDANSNGRIDAADAAGEFGFEFGFSKNNWFIRQAAQGTTTNSPVSLGSSTWYCELRVDLAAHRGDGAGSLFIQQLGTNTGVPVTDGLKPVASLQNINLGIKRMAANGGNSDPGAWNGIYTRLAAGSIDALGIAHSVLTAKPDLPPLIPQAGTISNQGDQIKLLDSGGKLVDSVDFRPEFPWPVGASVGGNSMQLIHPSLDNDLGGSWRAAAPTPGAQNSVFAANAPPQIRQVAHSPKQPTTRQPIVITAKVTDPDGGVSATVNYQPVMPGNFIPAWLPLPPSTLLATPNAPRPPNPAFDDISNWTSLEMNDAGLDGDAVAGDGIFSATVPAQPNRVLLRYRIQAVDAEGAEIRVPYADDPSLNFACFIHDGVPAWSAAASPLDPEGADRIYPASELTRLPVHTLITRNSDLLECYAYSSLGHSAWQIPYTNSDARSAFNWEGAFVNNGVVYDHISYRLRQNSDRYSGNGKRSMRFRFNEGNLYQATDEAGGKLSFKWRKLNTAKMSRFGSETKYGIREVANSKLWRMFGVDTPLFYHAHMRVVDGSSEAPSGADGQYHGDFFGLALFYEDFDGAFLANRKLPKGNIYKWKEGVTNLADLRQYQARDSVADFSDFISAKSQLSPSSSEMWLRANVDWDQWYRYHTICEAVRHYDFGWQSTHWKNRGWYFMPDTTNPLGILRHIPHDHDASWIVGYKEGQSIVGVDFAKQAIFTAPEKTAFTMEYRNTVRECRDLLWTPETVNDVLARISADIAVFSLADRDRWQGAPAAAGYEAPMGELRTVVEEMTSFAFVADLVNGSNLPGGRGAYLDQLANDPSIPPRPEIAYAGPSGFPLNAVILRSSPYSAATHPFGAIQWRLAEITDPAAPAFDPVAPPLYEAAAVWNSGALTMFQDQITVPLLSLRAGRSYRARVRHRDVTGRWSHWSDPLQFTASAPDVSLYQQSLVISEIMYNPGGGDQNLEFVEIMNIGPVEIDLNPVRFTKGIDFDFAGSTITSLAPGARALVVRNLASFQAAYGTTLPVAGEYWTSDENNLSNAGEQLKLSYGPGIAIRDFNYSDRAPWPTTPDGGGPSLVLVAPRAMPDHSLPQNWRASTAHGGNPGTTDALLFTGDPAADADQDGVPALVEFLVGTDDLDPADSAGRPQFCWVTLGRERFPGLSYMRRTQIEDVTEQLQVSTDLIRWTDLPFVNQTPDSLQTDGRQPVLLRSSLPIDDPQLQFLRLKVTLVR